MFIPKNTKYNKQRKGKTINKIVQNSLETLTKPNIIYLKAAVSGRISSKQLTACKLTINKIIKKQGQLIIRAFADTPLTKKPTGIRMGKGKGNIDTWIYKAKAGAILFEINTFAKVLGTKALKSVQFKLPILTKIV